MLKLDIREIAARDAANGGHFFDKGTLRFFNDALGNWDAFQIGERVFIRNARHRGGRGMFAHCTLRGQVREIRPDGSISSRIDDLDGLRPLQIEKRILAENAAAVGSTVTGESNNG